VAPARAEDLVQARRLALSVGQTSPGDPDGCEPQREGVGIALAIGLEGDRALVELPAVELDDDLFVREQRVDGVAQHPGAHHRLR